MALCVCVLCVMRECDALSSQALAWLQRVGIMPKYGQWYSFHFERCTSDDVDRMLYSFSERDGRAKEGTCHACDEEDGEILPL